MGNKVRGSPIIEIPVWNSYKHYGTFHRWQQAMKVHRGLGVGILIRGVRWRCMVRAKLRLLKPVLLTEHWLRFRAT